MSRLPSNPYRYMRSSRGRPRRFPLLLIIFLIAACFWGFGRGRVVKVADGDTITVFTKEGSFTKVRLYGIDCPEYSQPGGPEAAQFTTGLAHLAEVTLTQMDRDQYGRMVAMVQLNDGRILNEELLRNGHAWVYPQYCRELWCPAWRELEKQARKKKLGLWAKPNPKAPWNWRKSN